MAAGFLPVDRISEYPRVRSFSVHLGLSRTTIVFFGAGRYIEAFHRIEIESMSRDGMAMMTFAAIVGILGGLVMPLTVFLR
jgi:hypothetical protein